MSKNIVTRHPVLTTLVVGSAIAGVVGARKAKEKVIQMKEDGIYDVVMFNCHVDRYLVKVANGKLDLDEVKTLLSLMDSIDEMRQTKEGFNFHVETLEKADEIGNLEFKFRQVLQTQRFILENY